MGVAVTQQKRELEEEHARSPNSRTAAEAWQHEACKNGLNYEQQRGTDEHRDGKCRYDGGGRVAPQSRTLELQRDSAAMCIVQVSEANAVSAYPAEWLW